MKSLNTTQNILKLDSTSDRYRVCPYCKTPHMVNHLGRDYCSDKCADNHYNEKRRLKKQRESILKDEEHMNVKAEKGLKTNANANQKHEKLNLIENNASIFDRLMIDSEKGVEFKIKELEAIGVDFRGYTILIRNKNVPEGIVSNYMLIKNYKITRVTVDVVHIIKTLSLKN